MASFKKEDSIFSEIKFNFPVMLSYIFLGMLVAEIFIVIDMLVRVSFSYVTGFSKTEGGWIITFTYLAGLYLGLLNMNSYKKLNMAIKSKRFDIFIFITSGITLTWTYNGFGILLTKKWIDYISGIQISVLLILPFIMVGITYLQMYFNKKVVLKAKINGKDKLSNFISDLAEEKRENDKFDSTNQANNFAENVYNNGSKESLVFGIDAPWGSGKSTFVNFCKEYWEEKYKEKIIVYNFDVLRYEDEENLFNKFVDGLIKEIKNNMFAPELESLISRYAKILTNSKATISLGPFRFSSPIEEESIDKVVDHLGNILEKIDHKIIVIVDDLDRLNFSSIKEILFVIKKAFTFPNISYVLCYDTENISVLEQQKVEEEKISEFLEKFVNIKTSIFSNSKLLENYFVKVKETSLLLNEEMVDSELVINVLKGLQSIFSSSDFHFYIPFIGDLRKLKRLVNLILLLKVDKVDFENTDFDEQDLIHLLLIYIHYPNIFRKIYNTETQGKNRFFSLIEIATKEYKNSSEYINYVGSLNENQKFLLKKLFDAETRKKILRESKSLMGYKTYACFNGSSINDVDRNLEQYLYLIVNISPPIKIKQHKFYVEQAKLFLENQKTIEQILDKNNIKSEFYHYNLFSTLLNTSSTSFNPNNLKIVINYLLNNSNKYSIINFEEELSEFRNRIPSTITKFLNKFPTIDIKDKEVIKNINAKDGIINFIFGNDQTNEIGILQKISNKEKGVLGFQDLLRFRQLCYKGTRTNIIVALFNQSSSSNISKDFEYSIPMYIDSIRNLSQKVYWIFKYQYIDEKINIFEHIEALSAKDMIGDYYSDQTKIGDIKKSIDFPKVKNQLIKFIEKELINPSLNFNDLNNDLSCGYYDEKGEQDQQGISQSMNAYLFDICFNPEYNLKNYIYFLDYMLINSKKINSKIKFTFSIKNEIFMNCSNVIFFSNYWKNNRDTILNNDFQNSDRIVVLNNYNMSYKDYIQEIYSNLDEILGNQKDNSSG